MSIESDSRGELYQYFLAEAPELLQIIEETLLSLIEEKTVEKVHTLMRSAHTLKGSAASVEEETIQTIAHHLEDVFEALYSDELTIDAELGSLLLEGYDCLREPLSATLAELTYDENAILEQTAEVFAQLQEKLGDFFGREATLPTSEELGFDVIGSIFTDSVVQDLELLEEVIASQNPSEIETVLRSQIEFFSDLSASYDLPGLAEIAQTTLLAIEQNPDRVLDIAVVALHNFHQARTDILEGDRDRGGEVFADLLNWVQTNSVTFGSQIDPDSEIFEQSFFFEAAGESEELVDATMAFATSQTANHESVAIELVRSEAEKEENLFEVDNTQWQEIPPTEEIATLESEELESEKLALGLKTNCDRTLKSPVEEILQSIVVLNTPLTSLKQEENLERNTTQNTSNATLPSIKVAIEQLDRLNHTIGELLIKENQQKLQQEQLQLIAREVFQEFRRCQQELFRLGDWSEQQKRDYKFNKRKQHERQLIPHGAVSSLATKYLGRNSDFSGLIAPNNHQTLTQFDALEMDVYSDLDLKLQSITENMTQLGAKIESIERVIQQSFLDTSKRKQLLDRAQKEVLQARMLPLSTVLNRFPRHLQQMVASHQKPAKLKNIGGEVNIDKAIAEKLYEPLLHLLRNAYDHGLETPEIRQQQGKPEVGKITIRAYNQGNRTIIEVQDDGQGIDLEKVLTKAIAKNLINPAQLDNISETEITDVLFQPGFSTAAEVTDLSGRGVGLNVVKSQIKALDGKISIRSIPQEGTTFILQLPLNLTTARLLLCESQNIIYGILSTEITKIITPLPEQVLHQSSIKGESKQSFFRYQDRENTELIPICSLENLVNYPYPVIARNSSLLETLTSKKKQKSSQSLILVETEDKKLCLQVTRILVEQELVIKSLNNLVILPSYIQGYTVLGDGNLSLVINPIELVTQTYDKSSLKSNKPSVSTFELSQSSLTKVTTPANTKAISYHQPTILVVEDSIVQRQSLVMMLTKDDYKIIQAANGQEAIAQIEQNSEINLIISDVEMPVMNGFELLSYCQNHPKFSHIPVMMITTRSGQKHRELASSLGAKVYMTKPANEREILKVVAELISN
jgi:two-component system, chemotaxis family, sensor histidine kinase and response regulator PixL